MRGAAELQKREIRPHPLKRGPGLFVYRGRKKLRVAGPGATDDDGAMLFPRPAHPPRSREMNMTGLYCQPPWMTMLTTGFFSSACEKVYS